MPYWITLTALLVPASALALAILLRQQLTQRQRDWEARWLKRGQIMQAEIGKLKSEIQELKDRLEELDQAGLERLPPGALNLNRRSQVLRLLRRGEPSDKVALAVGISRCEVELIAKVHRILREGRSGQAGPARTVPGVSVH